MKSVKASIIALAAVCLILQGCVAAVVGAGAGAGTYAYVRGEYRTTYAHSLGKTYSATLAALKELQMPVVNSIKDLTDGTIDSKKGDGSDVKILLKSEGENVTSVKVRIGIFGDEAASKLIVSKISEKF